MQKPRPWILWLPKRFHTNPLGMVVAFFFGLVGVTYLINGGSQNAVAILLHSPIWIRIWALSLIASCVILGMGILKPDLLLEKLGCRLMSLSVMTFVIWVCLAAGLQGVATVAMGLLLTFFLQLRVGVITQLLNPWVPPNLKKGGDPDES